MERFAIGTCRTGKVITSHPDLDGLTTYEEVFDAMAVLSLLAVLEHRRDEMSEVAYHLYRESLSLVKQLQRDDQWLVQMEIIGAKTSLDIRRYAECLLRPEFKV
jgi:hypothetical protein